MEIFSGVYESSPWVAERALALRPFANASELRKAFQRIVDQSSTTLQDALILAHPDLGGRLARSGRLTAESTREQSRLGLDRLDAANFELFSRLNAQYLERFKFPFIICVGLLADISEVRSAFESRLLNSTEQERAEALQQIHLIAGLRLTDIVEGMPTLPPKIV